MKQSAAVYAPITDLRLNGAGQGQKRQCLYDG